MPSITGKRLSGVSTSGAGVGFVTTAAAGIGCPGGVDEGERDAADEQPRKPNKSDKVAVMKESTRGRGETAMCPSTLAGSDGASSRNQIWAASLSAMAPDESFASAPGKSRGPPVIFQNTA
jgi:hypothetical protein